MPGSIPGWITSLMHELGFDCAKAAFHWGIVPAISLPAHGLDHAGCTENFAVTGSGATIGAIQRMVPAHAQEINSLHGWTAKAGSLPNGAVLTVTASDTKEIQHIRGLGFIGLLVSGSHHQPHHIAMAKGEFEHEHLGNIH